MSPDQPVLTGLDLRIDDDDRIGLLGANGNGKSTFAKLIAGRLAPLGRQAAPPAPARRSPTSPSTSSTSSTRRSRPTTTSASCCPTRPRHRCAPAPARSASRRRRWTRRRATFRAARRRGSSSGSPPSSGANLMILDEPTNHLDIDSREALVQALADYPGAVILISHDRHLLEASVDRLWLVADGTVRPFDGDIDDYRRLVLDSRAGTLRKNGGSGSSPAAARRREAADRREQSAPLRKKIKEIESLIAKLRERDSSDRPAARRAIALRARAGPCHGSRPRAGGQSQGTGSGGGGLARALGRVRAGHGGGVRRRPRSEAPTLLVTTYQSLIRL